MVRNKFYFRLAGVLLLALSAASILTTQAEYTGVVAGVATVSALALMRSAEKSSLQSGRTDQMKVALVSSNTLYELILLLGAVSLPIIPKYAAAILLASVAFAEILRLETEQSLRETFSPDIAREGRLIVLALALVAYSFNPYFLFYGVLFIALLAIYDSLRLIHQLYKI